MKNYNWLIIDKPFMQTLERMCVDMVAHLHGRTIGTSRAGVLRSVVASSLPETTASTYIRELWIGWSKNVLVILHIIKERCRQIPFNNPSETLPWIHTTFHPHQTQTSFCQHPHQKGRLTLAVPVIEFTMQASMQRAASTPVVVPPPRPAPVASLDVPLHV